jgi:hypothetical protein
MRCYFMRAGHIEAVEILEGLTDEEAIEKARSLFTERAREFDGFELWDRARVVLRWKPDRKSPPETKRD